MSKKKNFISAALITGVTAGVGALAYKLRKDQKTFTVEKWNSDISKRYRMVDNLIRTENLIGKTREEIVSYLGINGLRRNEESTMEYYLSLDTEEPKLLIIELSEEEKAVNCYACI